MLENLLPCVHVKYTAEEHELSCVWLTEHVDFSHTARTHQQQVGIQVPETKQWNMMERSLGKDPATCYNMSKPDDIMLSAKGHINPDVTHKNYLVKIIAVICCTTMSIYCHMLQHEQTWGYHAKCKRTNKFWLQSYEISGQNSSNLLYYNVNILNTTESYT